MATTIYIVYALSNGDILSSRFGLTEEPITPGAGEAVLDAGLLDTLPTPATHCVDLGPPAALQAKTQGEIDTEANAEKRRGLRQKICTLDATQAKYAGRGWATTDIDAEIVALVVEHDAIP